MMLHRADVGRALLDELRSGYDVVRISRWAYRLHLDAREFDSGLVRRAAARRRGISRHGVVLFCAQVLELTVDELRVDLEQVAEDAAEAVEADQE